MLGLVDAAGLRGQGVACDGVGAGARAAADFLVLAGAALALQLAGVAQRLENRRVAINFGERGLADVACVDGQKAAGVDVAHVGDEQEALAVVHAAGGPVGGAGFGVAGGRAGLKSHGGVPGDARMAAPMSDFALFQVVLQQVAAVMHGLGGLDLEVDPVGERVDLPKNTLKLVGVE